MAEVKYRNDDLSWSPADQLYSNQSLSGDLTILGTLTANNIVSPINGVKTPFINGRAAYAQYYTTASQSTNSTSSVKLVNWAQFGPDSNSSGWLSFSDNTWTINKKGTYLVIFRGNTNHSAAQYSLINFIYQDSYHTESTTLGFWVHHATTAHRPNFSFSLILNKTDNSPTTFYTSFSTYETGTVTMNSGANRGAFLTIIPLAFYE